MDSAGDARSKRISKAASRSKEGPNIVNFGSKIDQSDSKERYWVTDSSDSKGLGQIIRDTSDTGNPESKGHVASNLTPKELSTNNAMEREGEMRQTGQYTKHLKDSISILGP